MKQTARDNKTAETESGSDDKNKTHLREWNEQ